MLLKGAYCVGEHFVDIQGTHLLSYAESIYCENDREWLMQK